MDVTRYAQLPYDLDLWLKRGSKSKSEWLLSTPFPMEVFPEKVREFVRMGSMSLFTSDEFLATAALVVAGSVVGKSRALKAANGYEVFPNLFACLVGKSGSGKTPAIQMALKPITRNFKSKYRHFMTHAHSTAILKNLKKNGKYRRGNFSLALYFDELKGFFKVNSQKGLGGEGREDLFKLHDCNDISIDRISSNIDLQLEAPIVSLIGCMVPSYLHLIKDGSGEDGIIGRFLFSLARTPENDTIDEDLLPNVEVPETSINFWKDLIRSLNEYNLWNDGGFYKPVMFNFDTESKEIYRLARRMFRELLREKTIPHDESVDSILSKSCDRLCRLALILQILRNAEYQIQTGTPPCTTDIISGQCMLDAIRLLFHFHVNSLMVLDRIEMKGNHERALAVFQFCKDNDIQDITRSSACRYPLRGHSKCMDAKDAKDLFHTMEDMELGEIISARKSAKGGRPGISFRLNFNQDN